MAEIGVGEIMMGSSALFAGAEAAAKASCLRAQAEDLKKKAADYKNQWNSLAAGQKEWDELLKDQTFQYLDEMNKISAQMRLMRASFQRSYKQIQYIGIIFVTTIFFLLLLKTFGLLGPLGQVLAWPFVTLFHKIKGQHGASKG